MGGGRIENGFFNKGALESETEDIRVEFTEPQLHRQLGKLRALQLQQLLPLVKSNASAKKRL